ncbi:hypothetical protein [Moraxella catarrhalis]|uniref:hypothetical protein n=1 Tax=Moraxella catarrhalis TaxID=480 RepID=UPI000EA94568|nr:hypothetical protein [Moraxella catarrhalis]RKM33437.1 hypothetical protein D6D62_06395 [Moraxella catarrhalis]
MFRAIFRPAGYLKIRSDSGQKLRFDWLLPGVTALIIAIVLTVFHFCSQADISIFSGESKLSTSILDLVQTLPGFYIAALAAVVAFNSTALDSPMRKPVMYLLINGYQDNLSRRRFLSYALAYLAFSCIILCLLLLIFEFFHGFSIGLPLWAIHIGYFFSCLITFFLFAQIISLTFLCLWYLGDRIHFNEPKDPSVY